MSQSDIINASLSILSFLLAVISIVTVVVTLRQNRQMIENATRPYIAIKYETITRPNDLCRYIVLKNYGQSAAKIAAMKCTGDTNKTFLDQFDHVVGLTLAPSQRLLYYFGGPNTKSVETVSFEYTYTANEKDYHESTTLQMISGATVKRSSGGSELAPIVYALQEITERMV